MTEKSFTWDHHDTSVCDWSGNIDVLLDQFRKEKEDILYLLEKNSDKLINLLWKKDGPLAIDKTCLCNLGKKGKRVATACCQCKNLSRIIDYRKVSIGTPFQLKSGKKTGTELIVKEFEIINPGLFPENKVIERSRYLFQKNQNLNDCGSQILYDVKYMSVDLYTNELFQSWIIEKEMKNMRAPHYLKSYMGFICCNNGYILQDSPSIIGIKDLTLNPEIVKSIIVQLLSILMILEKIGFSHGEAEVNSLCFDKFSCGYENEGMIVSGKLTVMLTNFKCSSSNIGNIRLFPKSYNEINFKLPLVNKKEVIIAGCSDEKSDICLDNKISYFVLDKNTSQVINTVRHLGIPLYIGSFDFYCFMVGLMCETEWNHLINDDAHLYRIWSMMWIKEDIEIIEKRIREIHKTPNHEDIVSLMKGLTLRCGIVKFLWKFLKSVN